MRAGSTHISLSREHNGVCIRVPDCRALTDAGRSLRFRDGLAGGTDSKRQGMRGQ